MNINKIIFSIAASCIFSLGFAQCPDSVRVYVDPEVICPGEYARLSTDSLLLHCVSIGDIICVKNDDDSHDTIIVSPNDWARLRQSNNLTALSIVFFVDSTCKHGWAVQVKESRESGYSKTKWFNRKSGNSYEQNVPEKAANWEALSDLDGFANTSLIAANADYAAAYEAVSTTPFYLPAIGQLNLLYSEQYYLNSILVQLSYSSLPDDKWWSSTGSSTNTNHNRALYLNNDGTFTDATKTTSYYVLPVMNF